jgi:hypothetical protein
MNFSSFVKKLVSPNGGEEGPDVLSERLGLLKGGETTTALHRRPMGDAVADFAPNSWRPNNFLGKERNAGRHFDSTLAENFPNTAGRFDRVRDCTSARHPVV